MRFGWLRDRISRARSMADGVGVVVGGYKRRWDSPYWRRSKSARRELGVGRSVLEMGDGLLRWRP
jgi:hypothetical protein